MASPSPSTSLSTLRPELATFEEFDLEMDRQGFIASRVLPVFDAPEQAGSFGKITIESLLQTRETDRAPGAGYSRGSYKFSKDSFATSEHGAEEPIDDRLRKMYRHYFDAEQVATRRAFDAVLRNQEIRTAAAIYNTTTFTGAMTNALTHEWDDPVNAVPITDVETAVRAIYDRTGMWANALIINRKQFRNLRNVAQLIERIAASGAGTPTKPTDITTAMLAACFDLQHIIVAGSSKNTANEGQSASLSQVWSDEYAMVCRVAETNDMAEPCLGRIFHWSEDGSQIGGTVETYRDETIRGDVVRVRHEVQEKILYAEMGQLLSNVTT